MQYLKTLSSRQINLFCLLALLCVNPLMYLFGFGSGRLTPDVLTYISFSKSLYESGLLYLPHWGHIDNGLILPPLYPTLVGLGTFSGIELLKIAEWISMLCLVVFTIPAYYLMVACANRFFAVVTLALIQTNYYYVYYGHNAYTEACFLLVLCITLLLIQKLVNSEKINIKLALLTGIASALVYLARQIGITVFVFILIWFIIELIVNIRYKQSKAINLKKLVFVVIGWLCVILPYTTALYIQSAQFPLQQEFRLNQYVVQTTDSDIASQKQKVSDVPEHEYTDIYLKRRLLRKLLPDASEMLSHVIITKNSTAILYNDKPKNQIFLRIMGSFQDPLHLIQRFANNIYFIKDTIGFIAFILFLISLVSPLIIRSNNVNIRFRLILPGFILFYLITLSMLGDIIERYCYILYPFALMQIFIEFYVLSKSDILAVIKSVKPLKFFMAYFVIAFLISTPKYFFEITLVSLYTYDFPQWKTIRNKVEKDDNIFTFVGGSAYMAGGLFRTLPNDSLEKVVAYARKTNVKWILTYDNKEEISLYTYANWLNEPKELANYSDIIEYHHTVSDHSLYKIKPLNND